MAIPKSPIRRPPNAVVIRCHNGTVSGFTTGCPETLILKESISANKFFKSCSSDSKMYLERSSTSGWSTDFFHSFCWASSFPATCSVISEITTVAFDFVGITLNLFLGWYALIHPGIISATDKQFLLYALLNSFLLCSIFSFSLLITCSFLVLSISNLGLAAS